jgi:hypothetical protein
VYSSDVRIRVLATDIAAGAKAALYRRIDRRTERGSWELRARANPGKPREEGRSRGGLCRVQI